MAWRCPAQSQGGWHGIHDPLINSDRLRGREAGHGFWRPPHALHAKLSSPGLRLPDTRRPTIAARTALVRGSVSAAAFAVPRPPLGASDLATHPGAGESAAPAWLPYVLTPVKRLFTVFMDALKYNRFL